MTCMTIFPFYWLEFQIEYKLLIFHFSLPKVCSCTLKWLKITWILSRGKEKGSGRKRHFLNIGLKVLIISVRVITVYFIWNSMVLLVNWTVPQLDWVAVVISGIFQLLLPTYTSNNFAHNFFILLKNSFCCYLLKERIKFKYEQVYLAKMCGYLKLKGMYLCVLWHASLTLVMERRFWLCLWIELVLSVFVGFCCWFAF